MKARRHWPKEVLFGWLALGLTTLTLPFSSLQARAICATEGPESVLACSSRAYAARDLGAWEELLAPDFTSVDLTVPEETINRAQELEITKNIFKARGLERLALEWGSTYRVVAHEQSRTWEIHDVPCTLTLVGTLPNAATGKFVFSGLASFWVREVLDPEQHYVIYRMETHTLKVE
jgi:hypothetical protein